MTDKKFLSILSKQKQIRINTAPGAPLSKCIEAAQEIANKTQNKVAFTHNNKSYKINPE